MLEKSTLRTSEVRFYGDIVACLVCGVKSVGMFINTTVTCGNKNCLVYCFYRYKQKSLKPYGLGDFFIAFYLSELEQTSFIENSKHAAEVFTQFQSVSGTGDCTGIQQLFDCGLIIGWNVLKFFVILHISFLLFG